MCDPGFRFEIYFGNDIAPNLDRVEKGKDLTQSYYKKKPYTKEKSKKQYDNTKTLPKTSVTQRLRTDLEWPDWVTTATQLVWLNRFTG